MKLQLCHCADYEAGKLDLQELRRRQIELLTARKDVLTAELRARELRKRIAFGAAE